MKTTSMIRSAVAALVLGTAGGLAFAQMPGGGMGPAAGPGYGYGDGFGAMGPRHGGFDRMLDDVGASAEQRAKIKQITQAAWADLRSQQDSGRALHDQMAQLLAQPTIDSGAVEAQRQRLMAHYDQVSKRMTQMMVDSANVLTPDQRKKFADRMAQRRSLMERHRQERESLEKSKP